MCLLQGAIEECLKQSISLASESSCTVVAKKDQINGFVPCLSITSLACETPGACTSSWNFWSSLCQGNNSSVALHGSGFESLDGSISIQCHQLDSVEYFDSVFFHLSPAATRACDPHQRLLLQVATRSLIHGGQLTLTVTTLVH